MVRSLGPCLHAWLTTSHTFLTRTQSVWSTLPSHPNTPITTRLPCRTFVFPTTSSGGNGIGTSASSSACLVKPIALCPLGRAMMHSRRAYTPLWLGWVRHRSIKRAIQWRVCSRHIVADCVVCAVFAEHLPPSHVDPRVRLTWRQPKT
jgi:hypothetical protein